MDSDIKWRISIIVTTYNSARALSLVLLSIARQTVLPYEVIVADDGSRDDVRTLIQKNRSTFPVTLKHSWQPDENFRLSRSRNLAVLASSGDWILFIDGDCLLPPWFVDFHMRLAAPDNLIFGARKLLSQAETLGLMETIGEEDDMPFLFSGRKFWKLPLGVFRSIPSRSWKLFRGFLMGMDKDLFMRSGGFDESFRSWGLEDSDFAVRAIRSGAVLKDGRYANAVLHLFHDEPHASEKSANEVKFKALFSEEGLPRVAPINSIFLNDV